MYAEELLIDEAGKRDLVEHFHCDLVGLLAVLAQALITTSLHYCLKLKKEVSCLHSWFPRSIITCLGRAIFIDRISSRTSIENVPRST